MANATTALTANLASQYTPGTADAANRIGGTVAYLNSLIADAHEGGYTLFVSELHEFPGAIGSLDRRMRPRVCVAVYAPGENVPESRSEARDA